MPAVHRPDPRTLVLDLTRRLAEEFHTVPLSAVTSVVKSAAEATSLFGEGVATSLETIERIAREDLAAVREAASDQARVALAG